MENQITAAEAAQRILDANDRGEEVVVVLVTAASHAGARLLFYPDGRSEGSLDDPVLHAAARDIAAGAFAARETLSGHGMFAEFYAPAQQLVIFGAGHIAVPLADLGARLGFSVTVLDDREEFATDARFSNVVRVQPLDLARPLENVSITATSFVVLVTRAHKHDFDLLRSILALDTQPRYIGMIGSRRRVRAAFTALLEAGISRESLASVHAPVGLDIGAETPVEIAVSIAAELIRVRRSGTAASIATEERVLERFFAEPAP